MKKHRRIRLNFYRRKGSAYAALRSGHLAFLWIVVLFFVLQALNSYMLLFAMSSYPPVFYHVWKARLFLGLDMAGAFQMLALLLAGYIFVNLGVFVSEHYGSRRCLCLGIAVHIVGIVLAVGFVFLYGMVSDCVHYIITLRF